MSISIRARWGAALTAVLALAFALLPSSSADALHTGHYHSDHYHDHGTHLDYWDYNSHVTAGPAHYTNWYNGSHAYNYQSCAYGC